MSAQPLGVARPIASGRAQLAMRVVLAAAVVVLVVWAVRTDGYFTWQNVKAILAAMATVAILGVGMTFIMVNGALVSLSLGTSAAVSSMVFMYSMRYGIAPAIVITLAAGMLIVGIQGFIIGGWAANPIMLTIAAGALQLGIVTAITSGAPVRASDTAFRFLNDTVVGVPLSVFVAIGFAALADLLLARTSFGRQVQLVGSNRAAARAAGLPLGRLGAGAFAVAGAAAAIAGMHLGAFNAQGSFLLEGTIGFDAIAATLVGGAAIAGGRGAAWRTVLGAFVIAAISDLLLLNSFSTSAQILVKGALVTAVVLAVHLRTRGESR